jgi:hypothetical protein
MDEEWTISFLNPNGEKITRVFTITRKQIERLVLEKVKRIIRDHEMDMDIADEILKDWVTIKKIDFKREGPKPWDLPNGKMIQPKI